MTTFKLQSMRGGHIYANSLCLLLCLSATAAVLAEEQPPAVPEYERVTCRVQVVDPHGRPVEGALVSPSVLITQNMRGSGWAEKRFGPKPTVKTDAQGFAEFAVPKFAIEKLPTSEVVWEVDHRNYVTGEESGWINANPTVIKIKEGYRIAATAVDAETGEPIKEHLYALMGGENSTLEHQWRLSPSGILISRVFDDSRTAFRLIQLEPDKPARFSDLISSEGAAGRSRVFVRNIKIKPGVQVSGRLDDSVPRPVKHGTVVAYISSGQQENPQDYAQLWSWEDKADIKPDGSFAFASLPQGDVVQLIALCEGFVSASPTLEEINAVVPWKQEQILAQRVMPQVFRLDEPVIHPTLKMEPTTDLKVTVLDPAGKPLPNTKAVSWPNQFLLRGGGTIVGFGFSSADFLTGKRLCRHGWFLKEQETFQATTDANGVAVIKNLPAKNRIGVRVLDDNFHQVLGPNKMRMIHVNTQTQKSVTIQVEPIDDAE